MTSSERVRRYREKLAAATAALAEQSLSAAPPAASPPAAPANGHSTGQGPQEPAVARDDLAWRDQPADLEPLHFRARHALSTIETCTGLLREDGRPAAALPATAMVILHKAAYGDPVEPGLLARVIEAGETLSRQLAFDVLARFPGAPA